MKKYFYFALALVMSACNNTDDFGYGDKDSEIRLTSNVVASRANTQATQIVKGEDVYVWLEDETGEKTVEAWKLTAGDNGELKGETQRYFPDGTEKLKSYAVHANTTIEEGSALPAEIVHTVTADQKNVENYIKSDMLYSIKDEVRKGTENALKFYHMLSKLEVKLIAGEGYTAEELKAFEVSILNTSLVAKLTIDKTKTESGILETTVTAEGDKTPILINALTDDYAEAVIVPQAVTAGRFMKFKSGEKELIYELGNEKVFEAGKKYKYEVTIKRSGISVTTSEVTWTDNQESQDAPAYNVNIKKAIVMSNLSSGAIRGEDGKFKAYYFFDGGLDNITSYVIGKTDDNTDLTVKTQPVTLSDDKKTVSWTDAIAGITKMSLVGANIVLESGMTADPNLNGVTDFLAAGGHYIISIDRNAKTFLVGEMCTLFKNELFNEGVKIETIELNSGEKMFAFTTMPDHYTSYKNTREVLAKDLLKISWTGEFRMNGDLPMNANAGQETGVIKNMFESYHSTNILVPETKDNVSTFYIINKDNRGWFKVVRQ